MPSFPSQNELASDVLIGSSAAAQHPTHVVNMRDLCNDLDDTDKPLRVAKCGRTTGWTFGQINAAMAIINPATDKEISGTYGFTMNDYGHAWAVGPRFPDQRF